MNLMYDLRGVVTGAVLDSGRVVPRDTRNMDWRDFLVSNPDVDLSDRPPTRKQPRSVDEIAADVSALPPDRQQRLLVRLLSILAAREPALLRMLGEPIDGDSNVQASFPV